MGDNPLGSFLGGPNEAMGIEMSSIPLIGGFMGPSKAQQQQQAQMAAAAQWYQNMRAPTSEASSAALQNLMMGIGGPGNNMMGQMYGQDSMMDFGQASQNPVTPEMLGQSPIAPPPKGPSAGDKAMGYAKMIDPALGGIVDAGLGVLGI